MMMQIAMNFSSERNHNMKTILAAISLALAIVVPAYAGIQWDFPSDSPGHSYGASVGSGTATITPGTLGAWRDTTTAPWSTFARSGGPSGGLWDLGGSGSILLS